MCLFKKMMINRGIYKQGNQNGAEMDLKQKTWTSCKERNKQTYVLYAHGMFYAAFFLLVLGAFLNVFINDTIGPVDVYKVNKVCRLMAMMLFLLKYIIFQEMDTIKLGITFFLIILAAATKLISGSSVFLILVLFIIGGGGIKAKKLAGISLAVRVPAVITAAILSQIGIIEDQIYTRGNVVRHSMGFIHPNCFAHYLFCICLAVCVIRVEKKFKWELILIAGCAYLSLAVSDSRTSFLILIIMAVIYLMFSFVRSHMGRKLLVWFTAAISIVGCGLSLLLMVIYDASNSAMSALNSLFSSRFYLANLFYETFGLTPLGYNYEGIYLVENHQGLYVDNAYELIILQFGIIALLVFFLIMIIFLGAYGLAVPDGNAGKGYRDGLFGMCLYLIVGVSESMMIDVEYNYFFVAVSNVFYEYQGHNAAKVKTPLKWALHYLLRGRREE